MVLVDTRNLLAFIFCLGVSLRADEGELIDCHPGESCHKGMKDKAKHARGQENELLIVQGQNDLMAAQAMMEGQSWVARAFDRKTKTMVSATIRASPACIKLLEDITERASKVRLHGTGRPRGIMEWDVHLNQDGSVTGWKKVVRDLLTGANPLDLVDLHTQWFSCGRQTGEEWRCGNGRCARCWNSRNRGLVNRRIECSNVWTGAPERASGGTGTIRGAAMGDAVAEKPGLLWLLGQAPNAADVEIFYTRDALKARKPGPAGTCTLGKVAFFFDSTGNPLPGGGQRSVTKWVAVAQYVTAAKGRGELLDPVTGHPVMRLQNKLSFFPAEAIRRTVHMYHRCPDGKCGPRSEKGKGKVWHHKFDRPPRANLFLYNKHFHGPTPSSAP